MESTTCTYNRGTKAKAENTTRRTLLDKMAASYSTVTKEENSTFGCRCRHAPERRWRGRHGGHWGRAARPPARRGHAPPGLQIRCVQVPGFQSLHVLSTSGVRGVASVVSYHHRLLLVSILCTRC